MASIEILPDKVLLQIFQKLEFPHLIWISVVSIRWNRVIFELVQCRCSIRIAPDYELDNLSSFRTYKHVVLREAELLTPMFSTSLLETLGRTAESLEIDCNVADPEIFWYLLTFFQTVSKLKLAVQEFYGTQLEDASFLLQSIGILPEVRHLKIEANFYKTVGLLAEMAPNLVTLDVRLCEVLLPKFYACRFDNLKELTFRLIAFPEPDLPPWFREVDLVDFLSRLNKLRKLDLQVTADFAVWNFSKLIAIEDLTLNHNISDFSGLPQMVCLRSLSCNYRIVFFRDSEPVPSLTRLQVIKGSVEIEKLTRLFPNLTALHLREDDLTVPEMQQIVRAWPSLEELSFKMSGIDAAVLEPLQKLRNLRKFRLTATVENEDDLTPLCGVLALESIRELFIATSGATDGATLRKWKATLAKNNPRCAVVIEKAPVKVAVGDPFSVYALDF